MAFNLTSPVTGGAQTGLTSPTYTHVGDTAPDATGRQYAVTALGGTQTGVRVHAVSDPFTTTIWRPKSFKTLGVPNSNGQYGSIGKNVWKVMTRKGVLPAANQPASTMMVTTFIEVPAGADSYDAPNIRACLSMHVGSLNQQSAGIGDSVTSGIM